MHAEPVNRSSASPPVPPDRPGPAHDLHRRPVTAIIEDEEGPRKLYCRVVAPLSSEVLTADSGTKGLALCLERQPEILLLDLLLPGLHGIRVLEQLRFHGVLTRVIVVSGKLTEDLERRAWQLGALAVLEKVVKLDDLLGAFRLAACADSPTGDAWQRGVEGTAAARWVSLVLKSLRAPGDPRVSTEVAARGAMSASQMKVLCHDAGVTAHDTCGLARMLGALVWSRRLSTSLESLMHFGDQRTLDRLTACAGVTGRTATATVRDLLDQQQFVARDTMAFRLLRSALLGEPVADRPSGQT